MKHWRKYALIGAGCLVTGTTGVAAVYISYQKGYDRGYDRGYDESEPVYLVKDLDNDGDEELCIGINEAETVCSVDINKDGAQDIVTLDIQNEKVKDIKFGKNRCLKNSSIDDKVK